MLLLSRGRHHDRGTARRREGRMPTERINGFHMYYEVAGQGVPFLFVHGGLGGGRGSALFRQHHPLVLGSTATQTVNVPPALASLVTFLGTEGLTHLQNMLARHDTTTPVQVTAPPSPIEPVSGVLQTYLAYHLHGDPIAARLGEITVPTLILHGTADEEVPFVEAECLHAGLSTSSLLPFVGGGHNILATHAEPYRQAILHFLHPLAAAPPPAV